MSNTIEPFVVVSLSLLNRIENHLVDYIGDSEYLGTADLLKEIRKAKQNDICTVLDFIWDNVESYNKAHFEDYEQIHYNRFELKSKICTTSFFDTLKH